MYREYFNEIGDEADDVIKEINGPSWSRKPKQSLFIDIQKNFQKNGNHLKNFLIRRIFQGKNVFYCLSKHCQKP